ncbi:hypothetical protein JXA47_04380 [Candidatus Sumerlaeota bacterium]|nr:hypothetical protein [Candidatus Sumerlaeota bacterium]
MRCTLVFLLALLGISPAFSQIDFGDGHDGPLVVSGEVFLAAARTALAAPASAGATQITVASSVGFAVGDEILIVTMFDPGGGGGTHEFRHLAGISGADLSLDTPLGHPYPLNPGQAHQVLEVPQFTDVTVESGGVLTVPAFGGMANPRGGVLALRCTGAFTVEEGGTVTVDGRGYIGGKGALYGTYYFPREMGEAGASPLGPNLQSRSANGGGGGSGRDYGGGGGAGHQWSGQPGTSSNFGVPGEAYGWPNLAVLNMGSGGGGGGAFSVHWPRRGGTGGMGGGVCALAASSVIIGGSVSCDANPGQDRVVYHDGSGSAGGGGSGGSLSLQAGDLVILSTGSVTSRGGSGGYYQGGDGSAGWVRIDYLNSVSGMTDPPAFVYHQLSSGEISEGAVWR